MARVPDAPQVIDLRTNGGASPRGTHVRIARHENPFEQLTPGERVNVIVRVLCGLVAYDQPADDDVVVDARAPEATTSV